MWLIRHFGGNGEVLTQVSAHLVLVYHPQVPGDQGVQKLQPLLETVLADEFL